MALDKRETVPHRCQRATRPRRVAKPWSMGRRGKTLLRNVRRWISVGAPWYGCLSSIVAAIAENGVIGDGRGLPWHLPSDLQHFRQVYHGQTPAHGAQDLRLDRSDLAWPRNDRCHAGPLCSTLSPAGRCQSVPIHVAHDIEAALALAEARARERGRTRSFWRVAAIFTKV